MAEANTVETAVKGLTAWEEISKLVDAFGGGWEAVVTIGILAISVVTVVVCGLIVGYFGYKSKNNTKIAIARIQKQHANGSRS